MGQFDVYNWLKIRALIEPEKWYTIQEITRGLKENGLTNGALEGIRADCIKLSVSKCILIKDLDTTGLNNYKRVFKYGKESDIKK